MAKLTQEQYLIINQHRPDLDCLVNPLCGHVRNMDYNWLRTIQQIHSNVLKCPLFNINCKECLNKGLSQLQNLLVEFEQEQKKKSEELDKQLAETKDLPRKGRKHKNWIV